MKIPGSDGSDSKIKLAQDSVSSNKTTAGKTGASVSAQATSATAIEDSSLKKSDSIQVSSLGAALRAELDPTKMAAERKAKIDALKKSIKDGTYNPPGSDIAKSFSEEVSIEILLGNSQSQDNESDSGLL